MLTLAEFLALDAAARAEHLATLDGEALAALRAELAEHFTALDATGDLSDDNLAAMQACADATADVDTASAAYDAAVAEREATATALRERMTAPVEPPAEPPAEGAPAEGTPAEGTPEALAAAAPPAAPRRSPIGAMGARRPATTQPRPTAAPRVAHLRAVDGASGMRAGAELDFAALGTAIQEALRSTEGAHGQFTVAQLSWADQFPEDRMLRRGQTIANDAKIDTLTSIDAMTAAAAEFLATNPSDADALTAAAGGFCAPFPIDYEVPVEGTMTRPVRDALTRFGAERGGISFTPPPALMSAAEAGVGTWTADDDAGVTVNPDGTYDSDTTKPIVEFDCIDNIEESVEATTFRASFSNFTARFAPEQIAAHQRLALTAAARFAERKLLTGLWTRADYRVTQAQVLGAVRDWLATLDQVLPQLRYRRRLARTFPIRVIAPENILDLFRADFVRQMPDDTMSEPSAMALADAILLRWASARNVNLTFSQESRDDDTAGLGRTQPTLAADGTGSAALLDFQDVFEWFLFPEGSVQFLDAGTLDLGIVRDTRTNAVNRYETFVETFEGIAKRGTPLYVVRSTLQPTGSASGLTAINSSDL